MKKINIIKIELIFLILILISLVNSVDFDGDGIDDGEQNLCGDFICQDFLEDEINCPEDCGPDSVSISDPIYNLDEIPIQKNTQSQENSLDVKNIESFASTSVFKFLIIGVIVLLIIGAIVIVFLLIKTPKDSSKASKVSSVPQTPVVSAPQTPIVPVSQNPKPSPVGYSSSV